MIGRDVEITVRPTDEEPLETLETFLGGDAHLPPPTDEEMRRIRALAEGNPLLTALLDAYDHDSIDAEAIVRVRAAG